MDLSLVRNITSKSSLFDIQKAIKNITVIDIVKPVLAEDKNPLPQETSPSKEDELSKKLENSPKIDFDLDYVNMLRQENLRLAFLVNLYQDKIDQDIPNLKVEIDLSIFDYNSAYEATVFYSKEWFAESLLSDDGKSEFANYLLSVIKQYCGANIDTLAMIADGNEDIIAFLRIPRRSNS